MYANLITLSRLVLTPIVVYMLYLGWTWHTAFVFTVTALTDWLDGFIARRLDSETGFGKLFDPLVDRIFIISTVVALYIFRQVPPLWVLAVVIFRDVFLMAGGQIIYQRTGERISVNFMGKLATTILMVSIVLIILAWPIGLTTFYVGILISYYAAYQYINDGLKIKPLLRRV